jgi:hypothetical protein
MMFFTPAFFPAAYPSDSADVGKSLTRFFAPVAAAPIRRDHVLMESVLGFLAQFFFIHDAPRKYKLTPDGWFESGLNRV